MKTGLKTGLSIAVKLAVMTMLTAVSAAASAQTAGTWLIKAGINRIEPEVKSGDMSAPALPGTKADVGSDTQPILVFTYMYTDAISAEVFLGTPYKHPLLGAGSVAGAGQLGTAEVLPPTVLGQYRFGDAKSMLRPYVGLGLTYAYFQKETGSGALTALTNTGSSTPTTFNLDNKFGVTSQVGLFYAINDKWYADASITKTFLKTTAHFSTGQTLSIKLDPVSINAGIGYRF